MLVNSTDQERKRLQNQNILNLLVVRNHALEATILKPKADILSTCSLLLRTWLIRSILPRLRVQYEHLRYLLWRRAYDISRISSWCTITRPVPHDMHLPVSKTRVRLNYHIYYLKTKDMCSGKSNKNLRYNSYSYHDYNYCVDGSEGLRSSNFLNICTYILQLRKLMDPMGPKQIRNNLKIKI